MVTYLIYTGSLSEEGQRPLPVPAGSHVFNFHIHTAMLSVYIRPEENSMTIESDAFSPLKSFIFWVILSCFLIFNDTILSVSHELQHAKCYQEHNLVLYTISFMRADNRQRHLATGACLYNAFPQGYRHQSRQNVPGWWSKLTGGEEMEVRRWRWGAGGEELE